jgi:glucosylceramidase
MLLLGVSASVVATTPGCDPVRLPKRGLMQVGPQGTVCRCTGSHCDYLEPIGTVPAHGFVAFSTSLHNDTERLSRSTGQLAVAPSGSATQHVDVNLSATYQNMTGFGAAFTDASVLGFNALTEDAQSHLLRSYWGEGGLKYSIGRVPIASTDFSTGVYSYNDEQWVAPGVEDLNLTKFSIGVDERSGKLPLIRRARNASDGPLRLFGSAWAPPVWMTTKNTTLNAVLRDQPGGPIHRAYARYLSRFVTAYEEAGVRIWGITGGNEPAGNTGKWQDLKFSAAQQRDFIKADLGPVLRAENPECKLMILDDQRAHLPKWADTVLADADAAQYVDGIGVHWYAAVEDALDYFGRLSQTHAKHPHVFILGTEACEGYLPWSAGPFPGDWLRGERYALDVMGDVNNFASGWTDWNFCLDRSGGPNWATNECDSPVLVDTEHSQAAPAGTVSTFYKQPMFYYFGHIAAFVPPGATRLGVSSTSSKLLEKPQDVAAFTTPDGAQVVIVVMNRADDQRDVSVRVIGLPSPAYVNVRMAAHSIRTFVLDR